jgi:hypothetical protein
MNSNKPDVDLRQRDSWTIYLGLSKSNVGLVFFSYRKLEEIFFFYGLIEQMLLYFSMLFHRYSTNIIIIKFRQRAVCYDMWRLYECSYFLNNFWYQQDKDRRFLPLERGDEDASNPILKISWPIFVRSSIDL